MYFVYLITNYINNKKYVGITKNLNKRINEHKCCKKSLISKAINKYGINNFSFETLEVSNNKEIAWQKEKYYIKIFNTIEVGYNIQPGGQGIGNGYKRKPITDETRRKMSIASLGRKSHTSPHSELTKLRISMKNKNRINEYTRLKSKPIIDSNGNKYKSIEEAAKILNVYPQNILKVLKGLRKTTGGLSFQHIKELNNVI